MAIKTKRWNDPIEPDDGFRLLVCRYRPRGLPKTKETWDAWDKHLGPSRELHAAFYGKHGPPIEWEAYVRRYLLELDALSPMAAIALSPAGLALWGDQSAVPSGSLLKSNVSGSSIKL